MTKDFLDFSRLESGRMRLAREVVALQQIIEEVISISQAQAAARRIEISSQMAPNLPTGASTTAVIGDADRLKQVLLNLVSNATKYNVENGRITINAIYQDDEVQISIADTGPGIAPEDMEHLFERFYRIPGSESAEGSGLGLSVAQKIVEEHNGRIEVTSTLGEGTTFAIFLPVQQKL
jgi:signal transduction histidine kinase